MTCCICGNRWEKPEGIRVNRRVCRCDTPGPGKRAGGVSRLPDGVTKEQYEERTRLGLPVVTDIERAAMASRWD